MAYDAGEVLKLAGRVPTSRLVDDDLTGRSPTTLVDALADHNQAFLAHEVASWTRAAAASTRSASSCCATGSRPKVGVAGQHRLRVLGVVPLEVTDALLDQFHRLADRHERGFLVEQVMELLAAS